MLKYQYVLALLMGANDKGNSHYPGSHRMLAALEFVFPGQHAEEASHVVEYGERDEGRLRRQPRRVRVHHGVGGERQEGHDEHGAVPKKTLEKITIN